MIPQSKTLFEQYNEFASACGNPRGAIGTVPNLNFLAMCLRLVHEEWDEETLPAIRSYSLNPSIENFTAVTDGLVDTVYVLLQLARTLGVPFDAAFNEVHQSNMAKVVDGKVIRREDGKILKPDGWQPPNLWDICYAEYVLQMKAAQNHQPKEVLGD